jgi:hypothetical protein
MPQGRPRRLLRDKAGDAYESAASINPSNGDAKEAGQR